MGFLILSRREGEGITLSLKADYPAEELIRQLREGGIGSWSPISSATRPGSGSRRRVAS